MLKTQTYKNMKDSGVEWLGEIPAYWELTRLGTRFKERKEKVSDTDYPPLSVTKNGIVPQLANAAKTNDGDNRKLVRSGDFVINSRSDRKGSSGISDRDGSVSLINIILEPQDITPRYCHYLLKSYSFIEEFYRMGHGIVADLWTTRYDEMKAVMMGIPPLPEQIAIAAFLDKKVAQIDAAVSIKQKQIALLKERKQILIQNAVTQGLNPNTPMRDSGVEWIGKIPRHWEMPKTKFLTKFILDGTHGSYPRVNEGFRLLSVRNIVNDTFIFRDDDSKVTTKHFKEISAKFLIREGDIQLAIVGATLGKVALTPKFSEKIVTQRSVCTIRTKQDRCLNSYMNYFMKSFSFQSYLWNSTSFSAQPGVYLGTIQNSYIPLPRINEQTAIVIHIEKESAKIDQAINLNQQQIEKLKEYKATLINSAVTGKIKVVDSSEGERA